MLTLLYIQEGNRISQLWWYEMKKYVSCPLHEHWLVSIQGLQVEIVEKKKISIEMYFYLYFFLYTSADDLGSPRNKIKSLFFQISHITNFQDMFSKFVMSTCFLPSGQFKIYENTTM